MRIRTIIIEKDIPITPANEANEIVKLTGDCLALISSCNDAVMDELPAAFMATGPTCAETTAIRDAFIAYVKYLRKQPDPHLTKANDNLPKEYVEAIEQEENKPSDKKWN